MVPTFLGSTVLVFVILQIAPGGPIEKAIMELQMGGMEDGGSGGNFSENVLPESALKELERFYGFDKPIYLRYLSWLGIAPREIRHRDFKEKMGLFGLLDAKPCRTIMKLHQKSVWDSSRAKLNQNSDFGHVRTYS